MIEVKREEFKKDPVWHKIYMLIMQNHKVARHTERVLRKNKHIENFCEESRHYAELPKISGSLYIHYDVASWWKHPNGVQLKIETIGIYDDRDEYEKARMSTLYCTPHSDGSNLN